MHLFALYLVMKEYFEQCSEVVGVFTTEEEALLSFDTTIYKCNDANPEYYSKPCTPERHNCEQYEEGYSVQVLWPHGRHWSTKTSFQEEDQIYHLDNLNEK